MIRSVQILKSRSQTGREIKRLAKKYYNDLGNFLETPLDKFYSYVKNIPYQEDPRGQEIVKRPAYLLSGRTKDCKKAAVLIGSWLEAHGIPWRLVAVSERPDREIHHVFNQARIDGEWKNIDATYPDYKLFQPKPEVTAAEEIG
jgi:hypothetical protein